MNLYEWVRNYPTGHFDAFGLQAIIDPIIEEPIIRPLPPYTPPIRFPAPPQTPPTFGPPIPITPPANQPAPSLNNPNVPEPSYSPYDAGKDCNGKCNPCRPNQYWMVPGDAHGSTKGVHWHGIEWHQTPDCICHPKRVSNDGDEPMPPSPPYSPPTPPSTPPPPRPVIPNSYWTDPRNMA